MAFLVAACATQPDPPIEDSTAPPPWGERVRYGGGPSIGPPPSSYTGEAPPEVWCWDESVVAQGDVGVAGFGWNEATTSWLRQLLTDSAGLGPRWREAIGGTPPLSEGDTLLRVDDDPACREMALIVNRDVLGWEVGPPPVVVLQHRDFSFVFPSNASRGEFGLVIGLDSSRQIRGVLTW